MKKAVTILLLVLAVQIADTSIAGPLGISVDYTNELELLDLQNGPQHLYGVINVQPGNLMQSVAVDPNDGKIYGGDSGGMFYLIDPANPNLSTPLLNLGIGPIEGLDFIGSDLYAVNGTDLFWIDPTGPVVSPSLGLVGSGYATSIALDNLNLAYMTELGPSSSEIWSIDPQNGITTFEFPFTPTDQARALDLASDSNYYGLVFAGKIYRFDMVLQTASQVFNDNGSDYSGLATIDGTSFGACCLPDGNSCTITSLEHCNLLGGIYMGDDSDCDQPCEVGTVQESWSAVKTMYR